MVDLIRGYVTFFHKEVQKSIYMPYRHLRPRMKINKWVNYILTFCLSSNERKIAENFQFLI